jgi:hypothetical protein
VTRLKQVRPSSLTCWSSGLSLRCCGAKGPFATVPMFDLVEVQFRRPPDSTA